jgi:succinoglycan biosynthesis protein ExoA
MLLWNVLYLVRLLSPKNPCGGTMGVHPQMRQGHCFEFAREIFGKPPIHGPHIMTRPVTTITVSPDRALGAATASITVIVPVRNEAAFLGRTLEQLLDQDQAHIHLEIVVVDGQSTDATYQIACDYAARYPQVKVLQNPRRLSSAARNLAIAHSKGEYLVIVDGHCEIPSRRYYRALVEAFERSGADCLGRPQPLDVTGATALQRAIAIARSSRLGHHPESFIYADRGQFVPAKSVAVAYRRRVFEKVGLFDESMDAHEDGEFNFRCDQAGLRCYLAPEITVRYFPRDSLRGLFRQMVRYGRGRVRFSRKHSGTYSFGVLVPALFVLFLIIGGFGAWLSPHFRSVFFTGIAIYLAAILAVSLRLAIEHRQFGLFVRVPLVFAAIHLGAGTGAVLEWMRPVGRVRMKSWHAT